MRKMAVLAPLALVPVLAACAGGPAVEADPRLAAVPLSAEARAALQGYFRRPNPKVFAFSPATGRSWYAYGQRTAEITRAMAIGTCRELAQAPCEVLAENDAIVWQPPPPPDDLVTTSNVNLRRGPGVTHGALTTLPTGTALRELAREPGWVRVVLPDGRRGFVSDRYLQRTAREETPTGDAEPAAGQGRRGPTPLIQADMSAES